ncbi:ATP synthase F1 subcomplex delta subunit [Pontibacter ummariensis]|uniref:ATP synthase subunit delta n=1 Tax=Pontibacter ummariensis TaxID=1610492 RepID=A0A239CWY1_9BACT|nr:ATP synthase F1 subunit delta [Pontibacter ummariensis]PRY14817.1 ATP synthase F1 subcomplex delta subunit [Pontibacter ummariensis]SNS23863.1 ATP synthase F1 subcomplex delta subunit [Pontibacter ummariensis]
MSDIRVASRYAKSLLELADEQGVLEKVQQDMQLFSKTVKQSRDFKLMLQNPIIKSDKKLAVINAVFSGKIQQMTQSFFNIVARKDRETLLEDIAEQFEKQYNEFKGIQLAKVVSAVPLSAALREELGRKLVAQTGKTIVLEEEVDSTLIGGFLLRVGDKQIDSSVKNSLRKLRNKFKDNPYINQL